MRLRVLLNAVLAVLVLAALTCLPMVAGGCAAAPAKASSASRVPTAGTTSSPGETLNDMRAQPGEKHALQQSSSAGGMSYLVPPQSLPAPQEELWVIQRRPELDAARDEQTPGSGSLVVPRGDSFVPVPLKHTDVKATVAGYVATVDVTQQFQNPFDGKIEAVYVFPLPHNAAVNEFVMTVGERRIRGIIREREEAKEIYEQAKSQGYVASLLEQDRPNVFTQKVANIEPGKRIDVNVRYFHTLSYSDGWYEWVFPMVVGPRFNPAGMSGTKSGAQYLRPGERSGDDISVAVTLDALVPMEAVESRTHKVLVTRKSDRVAEVTLDAGDRIPNRDFVLRWKVAGGEIRSGLVMQKGKDGANYFAMTIVPPADLARLPRSPVEMVFTLDVSGSMSGRPIEQAKSAVRWALHHLRPDDTFQVVRFAGGAEQMAERPVPATAENVRRALRYIEGTSAGGGTMMVDGLRKALTAPADESRQRYVVFLTDGYIGNDVEVLGALQRMLGGSRVFAMGVGPAVNRYLMEHMAKLGRGAVAYIDLKENAEEAMATFFGAVSHPAMTNLAIDFGGAQAKDVFPKNLPDLFVGRPVTVVGRLSGEGLGEVRVTGMVRGEPGRVDVAVSKASGEGTALAAAWARMKIAELGDRLAVEPGDSQAAADVRRVALDYGLMSAFTAFVAVDATERTRGTFGTTVGTPVPVPEGVRYETSVPE